MLASDPGGLPFLPLIYAAWADGELSGDEIIEIRKRFDAMDSVDPATRRVLASWLDPDRPPSPTELQAVLAAIREKADGLPREKKITLGGLGTELARRHGGVRKQDWPVPKVSKAIDDIDAALGLVSEEAAEELLAPGLDEAPDRPARFDPAAMSLLLDAERRPLRQAVRELLSQPRFAHEYGLSKEAYRERIFDWCKEIADQGWGALSYPKEFGGAGDMAKFVTAFEMIAFHDLSLVIKFGVQFGLFGGSIHSLGTGRHHEGYLAKAGTLELPGCFAMTELGHGSNVAGIRTVARYDPAADEFEVHTPDDSARKEYIGNAACHARVATVFAQLVVGDQQHGVHALVVPIRDENGCPQPGIRIEDCGEKLGLNGVDNGRIWFDHVRVPRENLLNRYADVTESGGYVSAIPSVSKRFFTMIGALVAGRVSVALGALSASKVGLTIAVRYAARRRQFGPAGGPEISVLDYLTHQRRLLPALATTYALDFALKYLVHRFVNRTDQDGREVEALAAALKAYTTWFAVRTLQSARECCGGQGYMSVNRFASLKADIDIFTTFEGDNTVLMQLVARGLLAEYQRQFEDLRPYTLLKFIAERAAAFVTEINPVLPRLTDEAHLRDPEFQLATFRYREERLLSSLARRLKHRIDRGDDSFDAANECQDHMLALSNAYAERIIVEQFAAGIETCTDESLIPVLETLRTLFALSRFEADRSWFLEAGYFSASKSTAIRALVNRLCREIRGDALALVDSFSIPDEILGAPIATG
jgi:acyl-CoA oxidase